MNTRDDIKRVISTILQSCNFSNAKIVLFGSRARNDFNQDSDWDLLIILKQNISREDKIEISFQIGIALAKKDITSDIIIRSQAEVKKFTRRVNSVTKTAIKEGVPL